MDKVRERLLDFIDMWFMEEPVMSAEDYDKLMMRAEQEVEEVGGDKRFPEMDNEEDNKEAW